MSEKTTQGRTQTEQKPVRRLLRAGEQLTIYGPNGMERAKVTPPAGKSIEILWTLRSTDVNVPEGTIVTVPGNKV